MTKAKYPPPQVWLNIEICRAIYEVYKEVGQEEGIETPIPKFDSRYPGALEGILGSVQYKADTLQFDLRTTAAYYFVHLAKSQCFLDANKRLAVIITNTFLRLNSYRLTIPAWILRDIAIFIAQNRYASVEMEVRQIEKIFHLVRLEEK
jgi:prophage maintenance system killer protein